MKDEGGRMKLEGGDSSLIPHPSSLVVGVIPARYASTRFPGKLLADLCGKPVLQWTWERAMQSKSLDRLVIAAGDERIAEAARGFSSGEGRHSCRPEVVEVFEDCPSGSDRVWRAARELKIEDCRLKIADCRLKIDGDEQNKSSIFNHQSSIIVNIQGDEPLLEPTTIDKVVGRLQSDPEAGVATAVTPIQSEEEYRDPSVVKVVLDKSGRAMYFSRAPIPYGWTFPPPLQSPPVTRGERKRGEAEVWRHIGLYAYRSEALKLFAESPQSPLELTEKLEQLRLLEQGVKFAVAVVEQAGLGVDTEGDLGKMRGMGD